MGPAALLTVDGRRRGLRRTTPVALIDVRGRQWIFGAYGEVGWVRNPRSAGEGVIRAGGRPRRFRAVELDHEEAAAFLDEVLVPFVRRRPLVHRLLLRRLP
jgi:deazaflavin-dependent oxidoreductase (nitroreductase family)